MTRDRQETPSAPSLDPLRTVVVGVSLDRESDAVTRAAADVARAAGARLQLVHNVELEPIRGRVEEGEIVTGSYGEMLQRCREEVFERAEELGVERDEIGEVTVELLAPHRSLLSVAEKTGAGLVVVGARRPDTPLDRLLGSTADRVMRQAACPTLIVREALPVPPRRVLAPVDLSQLSADSFRSALHLLRQTVGGARIAVECLYVLAEGVEDEASARADLERFTRENGQETGEGIAIEATVRRGEPAAGILAAAAATPTDLIALGTHGWGGFERLLLGSVASAVVREAPASVLVVPPATALAG